MTRFSVSKVEDVPVTARITWARNKHGTIHEMTAALNSGALDPAALPWIRRPIGRDLDGIRGAMCVVDDVDRPYRAIAQAIGGAAANDGADPSLTVAALEAAIAADVAAGHATPALADVERFFGEDGPEADAMNAAHPAVAALLDRVMS